MTTTTTTIQYIVGNTILENQKIKKFCLFSSAGHPSASCPSMVFSILGSWKSAKEIRRRVKYLKTFSELKRNKLRK